MRISSLADFPHAADALIPELLEQWRFIAPELTFESRAAGFAAHCHRDRLPIAWVAQADEGVMGTASLRACDLEGREDLSPWLGGVFVRPEFRGRGIASALCRTVAEKARILGYRQLFLFTLDQQALYARLGWRLHERVLWRGYECEVMVKDLGAADSDATLRRARRADIPAMHRVRMAVRENRLTSNAVTAAHYLPALEEWGRGWVVERDGQIAGFAIGNLETGNIWALFVDPEHEGRGDGRRLHDAMVDGLWAHGLTRLWLTTEPGTRAQRFYEAAGWKYTGVADHGDAGYELIRLDFADSPGMLPARGRGSAEGPPSGSPNVTPPPHQ